MGLDLRDEPIRYLYNTEGGGGGAALEGGVEMLLGVQRGGMAGGMGYRIAWDAEGWYGVQPYRIASRSYPGVTREVGRIVIPYTRPPVIERQQTSSQPATSRYSNSGVRPAAHSCRTAANCLLSAGSGNRLHATGLHQPANVRRNMGGPKRYLAGWPQHLLCITYKLNICITVL